MSTSETANSGSISAAASALVGRTLDGRFQIIKPIGQGAMGTVFLAKQLSVDRLVAVKVLRQDLSPLSKTRFMREARVISAITHPNIVHLFEFAHHPEEGLLYFAMEFIEGVRLSRLNKMGRLHPNLVIELCVQICSALAEAHSHMVIHRDLKPSNMMVRVQADGSIRLKVLDFGVARTLEGMDQLTADGVLCGTPAYMAPEQAQGGDVSEAIDLYALGINLYEMLAGYRPIRGATPIETAVKQVQHTPASLRTYAEAGLIPIELVELEEALLQKSPNKRPISAIDVRRRLLEIRADLGWSPVVFDDPTDAVWIHWSRPRLGVDGGGGSDDVWSAPGKTRSTAGLIGEMDAPLRAGTPSDAPVSQDSLPSRAGGGWDAFKATPSEAKQEAIADMMLQAQRDELNDPNRSTSPDPVAQVGDAEPQPRPAIPRPTSPAKLEVARDLIPDRPVKHGTTIDDRPRRRTSTAELIRFGVVAVATFIVVAAVFFYFQGSSSTPEPAAPMDEPVVAAPQPEKKKSSKAKTTKKKTSKPRKGEPIDLFGDVPPDDPDKAPIVIESGQ